MIEKIVGDADDGIRLDRWFKRHYPSIPHALLEKYLRKGLMRLEGKKAKSSNRVEAGQKVTLPADIIARLDSSPQPNAPRSAEVLSSDMVRETQRMVIYRDDHVLVINKPAGLAVQGGTGIKDSVDSRLEALKFDAAEKPRLVHRLDRDTSGVLVLARDAKTARKLSQLFAGKRLGERSSGVRREPEKIQKIYWALVVGVPKPESGEIDLPLAKSEGNYERVEMDEEGKQALTHYRVVEPLGDRLAWVELQPVTGRTHQLRVHMAQIGCPILGDGKYGGKKAFISGLKLPKQLHLHAHRIIIPPIFGSRIDVTAPLPEHMQESWKTLGL
jgi:23S rRNA pseudouridine955/2504/2580 synthase